MAYDKSKLNPRKQRRRAAIIRGAIVAFGQKGFNKTKIIDIAREADVADGTIYLYFENKDDVLIKVFQETLAERLAQLKEQIDPIEDKVEKIHKYFELHADIYKDHPEELRFFAIEARQSPQFYERYPDFNPFAKYKRYLYNLCKDAIDSGAIRKVSPEVMSNILYGTLEYTLVRWATGELKLSIKNVIKQSIDILHNGLAK
ncbi:MAG: TetR/AcrR family transcriptional regulator [Candidatus Cloacimonadales bacterium]